WSAKPVVIVVPRYLAPPAPRRPPACEKLIVDTEPAGGSSHGVVAQGVVPAGGPHRRGRREAAGRAQPGLPRAGGPAAGQRVRPRPGRRLLAVRRRPPAAAAGGAADVHASQREHDADPPLIIGLDLDMTL